MTDLSMTIPFAHFQRPRFNMPRLSRAVIFAAALVGGCALVPAKTQTDITNFITGLANKTTADLQTAVATASVQVTDATGTHAVDAPGAQCGTALLAVQSNVNAVLKASNVAAAGVVTNAETLSLFLPNTPQTNAVRDQIVGGCSVKLAQITQAVAGGAAWFNQLAALFAIQVAPIAGAEAKQAHVSDVI